MYFPDMVQRDTYNQEPTIVLCVLKDGPVSCILSEANPVSTTSCEVDGEHLYFTKHTVGFAAGAAGMGAAMAVVGTAKILPGKSSDMLASSRYVWLLSPHCVTSLLTNVDYTVPQFVCEKGAV